MKRKPKSKIGNRPPEVVELAQQKADFTAEGAPPPGRVATTEPVRPASAAQKSNAPGTSTSGEGR